MDVVNLLRQLIVQRENWDGTNRMAKDEFLVVVLAVIAAGLLGAYVHREMTPKPEPRTIIKYYYQNF